VRVKGQGFVPSVVANGFLQSEADTTMVRVVLPLAPDVLHRIGTGHLGSAGSDGWPEVPAVGDLVGCHLAGDEFAIQMNRDVVALLEK